MEQTRLVIKGMCSQFPPNLSEDGECSRIVNLRCKNGVWKPVGSPEFLFTPSDPTRKLIYVHKNEDYTNYITYRDNKLYFEAQNRNGKIIMKECPSLCELSDISKLEAIGNTLIVISKERVNYILFEDGSYSLLGNRPEFPEISFYLSDYKVETRYYTDLTLERESWESDGFKIFPHDEERLSKLIYGKYSEMLDIHHGTNRIVHPCLVRYGLRLYDGNYLMYSPPVLLLPQGDMFFMTNQKTLTIWRNYEVITGIQGSSITMPGGLLHAHVRKCDLIRWRDVVTHIDIFVSPEIPILKDGPFDTPGYLSNNIVGDDHRDPFYNFGMPYKTKEEIIEFASDNTLFYRISTMKVQDGIKAEAEGKPLDLEVEIKKLQGQPQMPVEDFTPHYQGADVSYVYNSKLHLGNVYTEYFEGFPLTLFDVVQETYNNNTIKKYDFDSYWIEVYLQGSNGNRLVVRSQESSCSVKGLSAMLSYPDRRAYKMVIQGHYKEQESGQFAGASQTFLLVPSKTQNMAYCIDKLLVAQSLVSMEEQALLPKPVPTNIKEYSSNKMIVSVVNNPFLFRAKNTYQFSNSTITGMAAATAALSQGQYGEFPLYVFTTEGIWALQQGGEEVIYARQHPVNREVCILERTITPIDNAVVYATTWGLMLLQGAESQLLSFNLDGRIDMLPSTIVEGVSEELIKSTLDTVSLKDYLQNSYIGYNVDEHELLILNSEYNFSYVFDLTAQTFYRRCDSFMRILNNYPYLMVQKKTGEILQMNKESYDGREVVMITRAIKLLPDGYKRLRRILVRCQAQSDGLQLSLWGSHMAEADYGRISFCRFRGDTRGALKLVPLSPPYKFHQIVLSGSAKPGMHLSAIDMEYEPTLLNKLR